MARNKTTHRKNSGNVLIFTCFGLVVIAIVVMVGYSFGGLYFMHNRLQCSADEIALAGAKKLNDRDQIGRMNNMVARCRQLVYSNRDDYKNIRQDFPDLEDYADQLMQESRDGAMELERERKKMSAAAENEAMQAMRDKFNSLKPTYPMSLPWLRVKAPRAVAVSLGRVDGIESNVEEFDQFDKLKNADRGQNLVAIYSKINIYKGDTNQQLKDDDTDLPFFVSSLPVPIDGIVSPARTMLPDTYKSAVGDIVPTAARIELTLQVQSGSGYNSAETMKVTGTALTTGASAPN